MTECLASCKWICIVAYILASLGAIMLAVNTFKKEPIQIPKVLIVLYLIGAIVTLVCSARWAFSKPSSKV
jgi:hypothetical protein